MSIHSTQIFQTNKPTRWQRYKWTLRILSLFAVIAIIFLIIAVKNQANTKNYGDIPVEDRAIKKVLTSGVPSYRESNIGKQYRGIRKFIQNKWAKGQGCGQNEKLDLSNSPYFSDSLGIRAAFYVAWDPQSLFSLHRNISKLNLVLPEWLFINP